MPGIHDLRTDPAWQTLLAQRRSLATLPLPELFDRNPDRCRGLSLTAEGLHADFSKQHWTAEIVAGLAGLAEQCGLGRWREALFAGERVNLTEGRAALHSALRQPDDTPVRVDGRDVIPDIRQVQARMRAVAGDLREGRWLGASGKPIRDVVNLGIGGSDLGPLFACEALAPAHPSTVRTHFVSNVDPAHLEGVLAGLDPAATLVVVTSKTFTTLETLRNARGARDWLTTGLGPGAGMQAHWIGVTANPDRAAAFGIAPERILPFWDWVGGRYSLWSAVGIPVAISAGWDAYARMLAGAASIDRHFRQSPAAKNLPVLLALSTVWNTNFLDARQIVLAPYSQALARFPAYVQQLSLESNGKRVTRDGVLVDGQTAPSIWGEPGTNAQHAFFQWLHQGTQVVPVEFIVPVNPVGSNLGQHRLLVANALAQAQALMAGKTEAAVRGELEASGMSAAQAREQAPHRTFPGGRPSTTLLLPRLDAYCLGQLIALFEHRTFVEALLWGINPFDQFGVELGKQLTPPIDAALAGAGSTDTFDASTAGLIAQVRAMQGLPPARRPVD